MDKDMRVIGVDLPQTEDEYRLLADSLRDVCFFMLSSTGHILTWNSGAERMKGYSRDEAIGKHFSIFYAAEDRAREQPEQDLQTALSGERLMAETWRVRKDGSRFRVQNIITALKDDSGKLRGFTNITRDITESQRSEETLRTLSRLAGLLDIADDAIISVNNTQEITLFNQGAERIFQYTSAEILGKQLDVLIPGRFTHTHQAHLQDFGQSKETARKMGERREIFGLRKNGVEFPAEASISKFELEGEKIFTVILRDITERKQAEEAVRSSEARFSGILDIADDAIISIDKGQRITIFNQGAEKVFGYAASDVYGKPLDMLLPRRFTDTHQHHLREFSQSAETARKMGERREIFGLRKNGTEFPAEASISKLDLGGEKILTVILRDITERKQAESALAAKASELSRSNSELQQFAYVASHDLQEPLRMVASYTQLLAKRYRGQLDENADEYIGFAVDGAARMSGLIDDLLTFSRLDSQGNPFDETDLDKVLHRALENLQVAMEESKADITWDAMPTILADEFQMGQLFQNLVGNALKFRAPDRRPAIHISAERRTMEWIFSVRDNGIGIDPQFGDRIFIIFQRLHLKNEYPGTGIGLTICKKIVERHGGRIWLEPQAGLGTTFSFSVPHRPHEFS
ncbi:MAG TPA: PAS domain S-box protein [Terriglobia bacterium]|jgi:PAS domain S-box-containing protein